MGGGGGLGSLNQDFLGQSRPVTVLGQEKLAAF